MVEQGLMQQGGLTDVEAAKADGSWQAAYSISHGNDIAEDFLAAVRLVQEITEGLNKQLYWLRGEKILKNNPR